MVIFHSFLYVYQSVTSNSFTYPKLSQMFQKTSGFVKKTVVSDFWGISSILRLLYRFFLLKKTY